jgi:putative hemolysin
MGCASISMADGGHAAASLYNRLAEDHLGPQEYRVFPRCPLPLAALQQDRPAETPPLIKGYLRAGAWICGEPAWDPDFNTADLPILMPMAKVSGRYAKALSGIRRLHTKPIFDSRLPDISPCPAGFQRGFFRALPFPVCRDRARGCA